MNYLPDHRCGNAAMPLHSRRGIVIALASAAVLSSPPVLAATDGSPEDQQFMRMAIDEARQGANVVVLSDKFWRNTFHADPQILGKPVTLDAKAYTVVGVMPPDFDYPARTELWMPLYLSPAVASDYEHRFLRVMGRLKPGVSAEEAQTRMNALERQIAAQHPQTDAGN